MPYWVSQKTGPMAYTLEKITAAHRDGEITTEDVFVALADLHKRRLGYLPGCWHNREITAAELYQKWLKEKGESWIKDYCVFVLPSSTNYWSAGTDKNPWPGWEDCDRLCRRLERENPGTVFQVEYEY